MSQAALTPPTTPSSPTTARLSRPWYRRAAFVIPLVLIVVSAGAAAVLLVASAKTITVSGKVIDRLRPALPVATATISTDGKTTTADAAGEFRLSKVAKDARLTIAAPNYADQVLAASSEPLTVRLVPVPVRAKVTSAMTGQPLTARFTSPAGRRLEVVGAATLYRVGPGDQVTVSADGYRDGVPTVATDRTLKVALEPTAQTMWRQIHSWVAARQYSKVVDWVLRPATGYDFIPPTPQDQAEWNKSLGQYDLYLTMPDVQGTNAWAGVLIAKPGFVYDDRADVRARFGKKASQVTLAGKSVWHGGPDAQGDFSTSYSIDFLSIWVDGTSPAETDRIMTGILRALFGSTSQVDAATNGLEDKPAAQVQLEAAAALKSANSVHVSGTGRSDAGNPMRLDARVQGHSSSTTMALEGGQYQVIAIGDDTYVKADQQAWKLLGAPLSVQRFAGRWVKLRAEQVQLTGLTLDSLAGQLAVSDSPVEPTVEQTTLNGARVVVVSYWDGSRLYVANTGPAYPLRWEKRTGPEAGQLDFTEYGAAFHPTAPDNAVDLSKKLSA